MVLHLAPHSVSANLDVLPCGPMKAAVMLCYDNLMTLETMVHTYGQCVNRLLLKRFASDMFVACFSLVDTPSGADK